MPADAAPAAPPLRFPLDRPLLWLLLLALGHVAVRVAISPALKWDEAEQMLWSQHLAAGYGGQPPLYTWLQWAVNAIVGPSVLALSVLKHALLALTYVLMWGAARELLAVRGAWWAAASMMLMPALGWFSIRDQTHTVLVTAMSGGAWWLLLRLVRAPRPRDFALLGLVCALGLLSKYSFALVALAMLTAALSVGVARRALLAPGWWWAPVVGVLVVLPHALWLVGQWQGVAADTVSDMDIDAQRGWAQGLLELARSVGGTLAPWALLVLAVFGRAAWRGPTTPVAPWAQRVFVRYLALIALALLLMVLLGGVTAFKGRWVLPMVCMVPLAAFAARPQLQEHPRARRYTLAVTGIALALLVAGGVRPWFGSRQGTPDALASPIVALAAALRQAGYDGHSPIIASDHITGGTLRTRFPHAPVRACAVTDGMPVADCVAAAVQQAKAAGQGWLLIGCEENCEGSAGWWALASARLPALPSRAVELPYGMGRADASARYRFHWQAPAAPKPSS
ncbi:ArnT family glycosyltransferase [Ottowia sp.]|uniref:ArnT family glycosyltransferase n=1 Tax=Ottowia sp. TaxID=1898956 RepID=UPI002C713427|nr:glycosyltransferase family 39 protein [Ottowia sp.]